jgi:hypothetical protein
MGFMAVVDEAKGEVTVFLGDEIVQKFLPSGLREHFNENLEWSGGDYLE